MSCHTTVLVCFWQIDISHFFVSSVSCFRHIENQMFKLCHVTCGSKFERSLEFLRKKLPLPPFSLLNSVFPSFLSLSLFSFKFRIFCFKNELRLARSEQDFVVRFEFPVLVRGQPAKNSVPNKAEQIFQLQIGDFENSATSHTYCRDRGSKLFLCQIESLLEDGQQKHD